MHICSGWTLLVTIGDTPLAVCLKIVKEIPQLSNKVIATMVIKPLDDYT